MQSARAVGQAAIWKTEMETAGNQKDSFNISSLQIWYQTVDTSLLLLYGSWMFKQYVLTVCDWLWAINKIPESGFYNRAKKSVHLYYIVPGLINLLHWHDCLSLYLFFRSASFVLQSRQCHSGTTAVHGSNIVVKKPKKNQHWRPERKLNMDHSTSYDYLRIEPCQRFTEEFNCCTCE